MTEHEIEKCLRGVGRRLSQARKKAGLSVEQAADGIKARPSRWRALEAGERVPMMMEAYRIGVLLSVNLDWLCLVVKPRPPGKRKTAAA